MDYTVTYVLLIVAVALAFDFINGFHDTANAIATSVATRVLSPGQAVAMAAVLNVVGALTGTGAARPGMLAALRDEHLHVDRIDTLEASLTITAHKLLSQATGSLYEFEIRAGDRLLSEGRVAIAFA